MKLFANLSLALTIGLTSAALALPANMGTECVNIGQSLDAAHSLNSPSIDPYSHLLPQTLDSNAIEMSSYALPLKPLQANDLTRLQFETRDNLGIGAGYSSPYLWEAGRGPGYRSPNGFWGPGMAPAPRPMPYPVRR